jgi:hypothetical protein
LKKVSIHETNGLGRSISCYDSIVDEFPPSVTKLSYHDCYPDYAYYCDKARNITAEDPIQGKQ